jgi:hypothetical protein
MCCLMNVQHTEYLVRIRGDRLSDRRQLRGWRSNHGISHGPTHRYYTTTRTSKIWKIENSWRGCNESDDSCCKRWTSGNVNEMCFKVLALWNAPGLQKQRSTTLRRLLNKIRASEHVRVPDSARNKLTWALIRSSFFQVLNILRREIILRTWQ